MARTMIGNDNVIKYAAYSMNMLHRDTTRTSIGP